jgi:hypothetical protein
MLQKLGADAVGMSTVLEVIQARALGMERGGILLDREFGCRTFLDTAEPRRSTGNRPQRRGTFFTSSEGSVTESLVLH